MLPRSVKPLDYFLHGFRGVQVPAPSVATAGLALFDGGGFYELDSVVGGAFGFPALGFQAGRYYRAPPFVTSVAGGTGMGNGRIYASALWIPRACTVRVAIQVQTLQAGSLYRLGIYNDNGQGFPGTVLGDVGTVSGATTGPKEPAIDIVMPKAGLYWGALLCEAGGGGAVAGWTEITGIVSGASVAELIVGDQGGAWRTTGVASGALPNPFPVGAVPNSEAVAPQMFYHVTA